MIRRVAVPSERAWYDTETGAHRHFYIEVENRVLDLPAEGPIKPPEGCRIQRVDTVIHLQRISID